MEGLAKAGHEVRTISNLQSKFCQLILRQLGDSVISFCAQENRCELHTRSCRWTLRTNAGYVGVCVAVKVA
jgi:hypothetical protein